MKHVFSLAALVVGAFGFALFLATLKPVVIVAVQTPVEVERCLGADSGARRCDSNIHEGNFREQGR